MQKSQLNKIVNSKGFMQKKSHKKLMGKIQVDRKIVEYLIDGKSLTQIQKLLKKGKGYIISIRDKALDHNYILPIIEGAKTYTAGAKKLPPFPESLFSIIDGRQEKPLVSDEYLASEKEWIKERIIMGWSPQTIFEELRKPIPRATFYRYLHRQDLMSKIIQNSSPEIIHPPGECLQVDWAKIADVIDPKTNLKKTISVFIGTVGHSRYQMVRVVECLDFSTSIGVLESMLKELGGVPRKVTSDNPKVFVKVASMCEPTLNPGYERFASHYNFIVEALPPADPELKGKVEKSVQLVRRLFESYDFNNYSVESCQSHADRKCALANERKHGTHQQKPIDVFINQEALKLKPLPNIAYEIETVGFSKVRKDGYVRFENKYYRLDDRLKGEDVTAIGNSTRVTFYCAGRLLEVYNRITDPFVSKACKEHYKQEWEKTLQDHGHYIRRAKIYGDHVARFVEMVLARGEGFVDVRVIWGIMSLDKKYSYESINTACKEAIELSQLNLRTVLALLRLTGPKDQKNSKQQEAEERFQTQNGKFTRPMSVYKKHLRLVTNETST